MPRYEFLCETCEKPFELTRKFMTESGAVPASTAVNIQDVVDARFLPSR
jgi:hypothetical protein